jgi:hypothetical protein
MCRYRALDSRHVSVLGSLDIRQQYVGDQLEEDHPHIDGYARMEEGQLPAVQMSTHAIKTELQELLGRVRPDKNWPKRVSVTDLCQYAIHNIAADSTDNDSRRALQLAQVLYDHERR